MQATFALTLAGVAAGLAGLATSSAAESPAERRHIQEHNTASSSSSSTGSVQEDWRGKINNIVVLVEENRSFDTFAGGLAYNATIDGLLRHNYCNALDAAVDICAGPLAADVAHDDPNHSIGGVNMQLFGTFHPNETAVRLAGADWAYQTMRGFVTEQSVSYDTLDKSRAAEVINYYVSDTGRGKTDTRD